MSEIKKHLVPAPFVVWANHGIPPPEGYDSFLAYAVSCMDTRSLDLENLFAEKANKFSREDLSRAVMAEYEALCKKAGVFLNQNAQELLQPRK